MEHIPTATEVLADPTASNWLKATLRSALDRDIVDAATDAEVLAAVLGQRCHDLMVAYVVGGQS